MSIWLLLRHLPPVSAGRLLLPAVFITAWTALRLVGASDEVSFVWACVLAQAAHVWAVLPLTAWLQRRAFGPSVNTLILVLSAFLGSFAFQIGWCDPWMSQRVVTICCALYAAILALGLLSGGKTMDAIMPVCGQDPALLAFRLHLAKLKALIAILFLASNEALLAMDAALDARVTTLTLLPVALHYVFHIAARLTCPPLDEENDWALGQSCAQATARQSAGPHL
ncbi:hypothetical protein ACEWPM_013650 [Roseovarius sp. S4756]|uniref:hypothetical protein n=1 Tax=Roseovarius maritimus TaxID=3342637 RepID=UPI00372C31C7